MKSKAALLSALLACAWSFGSAPAPANTRHFSYVYETAVLAPGERELELWTTWRTGRRRYYSGFDQRLELEFGVVDRLMLAAYLNFGAETQELALGRTETRSDFRGVSLEAKYQLSDPSLDALGFAVYGELSAGPNEYELESKLLFDKRMGDFLVAANLVGEVEWEREGTETEREFAFVPMLAAMYQPTPALGLGLEVRNDNFIEHGKLEYSRLHAGPSVAYAGSGWWSTLTFLPQLVALKGARANESVLLDQHERYELRLLVAAHL
ncbi:MAG: hypothetical protein ACOY0T_00280 [Myxococcota bacterium]